MNYVKPREPGYYWYNPGLQCDDEWCVVKVEAYGGAKPDLYFQTFGPRKSTKVSEATGVWGEKIADISLYAWTAEQNLE